jgi:hypothetical protein
MGKPLIILPFQQLCQARVSFHGAVVITTAPWKALDMGGVVIVAFHCIATNGLTNGLKTYE